MLSDKSRNSLASFPDELLVDLTRRGEKSAEVELTQRFSSMIRSIAMQYRLPGGEYEDLFQEGHIGLIKSVRDFRPAKGNFKGFAALCVRRQLLTALKNSLSQNNSTLNQAVSIDSSLFPERHSHNLSERLASDSNVEKTLIPPTPTVKEILDRARDLLSTQEYLIFDLYVAGYEYKEIAILLGKTRKSVDSSLFVAKNKIRKQLELQPYELM